MKNGSGSPTRPISAPPAPGFLDLDRGATDFDQLPLDAPPRAQDQGIGHGAGGENAGSGEQDQASVSHWTPSGCLMVGCAMPRVKRARSPRERLSSPPV